jgi:hypothetical protein
MNVTAEFYHKYPSWTYDFIVVDIVGERPHSAPLWKGGAVVD